MLLTRFENMKISETTAIQQPVASINMVTREKEVESYRPNSQIADAEGKKVINSKGKKIHKCPYENCGKILASSSSLVVHLRVHTGERPFACDWQGDKKKCDKKFSQKGDIKRHMSIHLREKKYVCDDCGFKSVLKCGLTIHILRHLGEKKYGCEVVVLSSP